MRMMKYVENPHAMAPNSALLQRTLKHSSMMKNPNIMPNSRLAGAGSHSI